MDREIEDLTVQLILACRAEYLANGASPLKHWEQLQSRLRHAAATSSTVPEFVTAFADGLTLDAPHAERAKVTVELEGAVEHPLHWLQDLEETYVYIVAAAYLGAEQRREKRDAAAEAKAAAHHAEDRQLTMEGFPP